MAAWTISEFIMYKHLLAINAFMQLMSFLLMIFPQWWKKGTEK